MSYKKTGIYRITNMLNLKVYIGQSKNIRKRWNKFRHILRKNICPNKHLQAAWNKYGEQNFEFDVIIECPIERLNEEEIRLIKEHNATNRVFGYNIEPGGSKHCMSDEAKQKLSILFRGRHHSDEAIKKIGDASRGRIFSDEHKKNLSNSHKGFKHSEEARKNMSNAKKGKNHPNFGKHLSKETRRKISESHFGLKPSKETRIKMSESRKLYLA